MQAIQRKFSFTKLLPSTFRCCSTIKTLSFCCLAFLFPRCSVFKVQRRVKLRSLRPRVRLSPPARTSYRFVAPPLPREPASLGFARTPLRSLVLNSELCRQSFGSFSYEIVTLTFRCFHNLSSKPSIALLSLFFSLFSFQGTAFRLLLKPDQNIQSLEYFDPSSLVEIVGIEPATSCLQGRRSPS